MTLTEFLLARIAEDEAWAKALMGERWFQGSSSRRDMPKRGLYLRGGETHLVDLWDANASAHIARHDPARVLAECEAKRRIVHQHGAGEGHECPDGFMDSAETDPHTGWENDCQTLKFLALPYADHPDYREEWKP